MTKETSPRGYGLRLDRGCKARKRKQQVADEASKRSNRDSKGTKDSKGTGLIICSNVKEDITTYWELVKAINRGRCLRL